MFVQAHRGFSAAAPQNTGPAFVKAVEIGADGIECDVHFTADRKMVVIHNFTVDETSDGRGEVNRQTLAQLRALDFGAWMGEEFRGTRILTLEEMLELVRGMRIINIELKGDQSVYPGLPEQVCALAARMGLSDRLLISSFDHEMAVAAKKADPGIRIGLLYDWEMEHPAEYAKHLGADAIHPHHGFLTREQVEACREAGVDVNPWTVDDPGRALTLRDWGCTSVITNRPDVILAALS